MVRIGEKAASTTLRLFLVAAATMILGVYVLEALGISIQPLRTTMESLSLTLLGLMFAYGVVHFYYSRKM